MRASERSDFYGSILVPRPTPGIDTLRRDEYVAGARALRRKIRRVKPELVAFIGVTLFRAVFARRPGVRVALGLQPERLEGAAVFVLPNPSGRNANLSYREMLAAFRRLRRHISVLTPPPPRRAVRRHMSAGKQ